MAPFYVHDVTDGDDAGIAHGPFPDFIAAHEGKKKLEARGRRVEIRNAMAQLVLDKPILPEHSGLRSPDD